MPFSPGILNVLKFNLNIDPNTVHKRNVKDYEIDYYIGGNRKVTLNNEEFTVSNGTVVFRRPGDFCTGSGSYNCYVLTLDFSNKKQSHYGIYNRNDLENVMQDIYNNPLIDLIPSHFTTKHPSDYVKIFDKLTANNKNPYSTSSNNILINQLIFLILSDVCHGIYNQAQTKSDNKILTETCKYIQDNFHRNISVSELANNVSLSPSYFLKMFKKSANTTPTEYIISIRLANAKQLLSESNFSVVQIAEMCGFNDASYFSHYFRRRFGMKPTEFRAINKSK